jgi:GT2 family glycosyltransferase
MFHYENYSGYTDSVYLGAWKKDIFAKTGYFDEEMFRNQDDEFHYRAKSKGLKIYLETDIKSYYFPRSRLRSLMMQYFQYGLFKPTVLKKVNSEIKLRHLVPPLFVFYLLLVTVLSFTKYFSVLFIFPLFIYFLLNFYFSFSFQSYLKEKLLSLIIFPVLHISYGVGFILGLNNKSLKYFFNG